MDVSQGLRDKWQEQVPEEQLHYDLISQRIAALGIAVNGRPVSLSLWESLAQCQSGREFCIKICSAEERGLQAGLRLIRHLESEESPDQETIAVFQKIVADEVAHVALASDYFDWEPNS